MPQPYHSVPPHGDEPAYLFSDLNIDPPLVEFRRTFEKKMRSFEASSLESRAQEGPAVRGAAPPALDASVVEPYRRAFEMGEEKIRKLTERSAEGPESPEGPDDGGEHGA